MTLPAVTVTQGDNFPYIPGTMTLAGVPVDLSEMGTEVTFSMTCGNRTVGGDCAVIDALAGEVEYQWTDEGVTDVPGLYDGLFHVVLPGGQDFHVPNDGPFAVMILPSS